MKEMTPLERYYNKFNEDKRLNTRHGQVEFITSLKYIHEYLKGKDNPRILDVGAGTGRYSIELAKEGYEVTAVELVQHNAGRIKQKAERLGLNVKVYKGNAINLKKLQNEEFDMVLVFGPMYHLGKTEDRVLALKEAKRVLKPDGVILAAYIMNEYSVISYAFKENNINQCIKDGRLSSDFHTTASEDELYHFVRLEDMELFNELAGLKRIKVIAADGPANYIRPVLNGLDEEGFKHFLEYHLATCERPDLMGASGHTVDILMKDRI